MKSNSLLKFLLRVVAVSVTTAFIVTLIRFASNMPHAQGQTTVAPIASVSAASYAPVVAPEQIVASFTANLPITFNQAQDFDPSAPGIQLPTLLGGMSLEVNGRSAGLFFTSPNQINFQVPPDLEPGTGSVIVRSDKGVVIGAGAIEIRPTAPAIFTANASGQGVPAGIILRVKANGQQSFEPLARVQGGRFVPLPLDLGPPGERVFLVLFLTGARRVAKASDTRLLIGGAEFIPAFVGAVPELVGVEQLNFELPRTLKGRLSFVLSAIGHPASNVCELEIAPPLDFFDPNPVPPRVSSVNVPTNGVLASETIEINGSGFSTHPSEIPEVLLADANAKLFNAEVVETTSTRLRVTVPFGAGTGRLLVRNPRGESGVPITLRTSLSGIVQTTQLQTTGQPARVGLRNVTVRAFTNNGVIERTTNGDGVFLLPDVPPALRMDLEIDGTTTGLPYPKPKTSVRVAAGRDNQFEGYLELKQATGTSVPTGQAGELPEAMFVTPAAASPTETEASGQTGQVVFEPNGSTVTLPDGTPVRDFRVTTLDAGRTPADLPPAQFSSVIVQLTPFGARIAPGGKLTFPNADGLAAGSKAKLFRYDQTTGSATLGQFVEVGTDAALVSADGQRVETARDAIKEATYYFVSAARTTTTIYGSVVEEDDTPARGALVQVRGKSVFALTDDNGAFILTNVPALATEELTLEVSYLRPDGTVDRTERTGVRPGGSALAFVSPAIVLTGRGRSKAPVVLAPRFLTVEAGRTADFNFIAYVRGTQTSLRSVTVAGASFAAVTNAGADRYTLRLTPGATVTGSFTLTLTARDSQSAETTEVVIVEVKAANANQLLAYSQSLITDEDKSLALTLQGSGGTTYRIVIPPRRGSLSGIMPNLVYTPEANYNGLDSFSFTVSNGTTTSSAAVVTLAIRPTDDAPRLDVGAVYTTNIGTLLNVVINGFDVDTGQRLTLTAANLPAGAMVQQTTATSWLLSWRPKFDQLGSYAVNLTLRDDGAPALSDSRTVTIAVDAKWAGTSQLGDGGLGVFSLAQLGQAIFAGTDASGVYRTTDDGVSWIPANNGLENLTVSSLGSKDTLLLAGTDKGVYRTTDNGLTWAAANNGLNNREVCAFAVIGNAIFAGTKSSGVYRTTNDGANWMAVNNVLGNQIVHALTVKDGVLFAGTGLGVYRLGDDGVSWTAANDGLGNRNVLALAVKDNALFAGTERGVYRTTNNGTNWTAVNSGLGPSFISLPVSALTVKGDALFAATVGSGVYYTKDNGGNWTAVSNGLGNRNVVALAVKDGALFAGTYIPVFGGGGVYRTTDDGDNWTAAGNGLGNRTVRSLLRKGSALFAGTDVGGVYRTQDDGASWTEVNRGMGRRNVLALAVKDNALFAGTQDEVARGGVYRTTDDGANWMLVTNGLDNREVHALVVKDNALFAGTISGVYRTTDNGANWMAVNQGLSSLNVFAFASIGNALFAGGQGGVYRLTDNGEKWTPVNNDLGNRNVLALAAKDDALFAGTYGGGVYCLTDNGEKWTPVNTGLGNRDVFALAAKGNALFAGTLGGGVYRTTDKGASWAAANNSLGDRFVFALTGQGNALLAGTGAGVFGLAEAAATWAESNTGITNRFSNAASLADNSLLLGTEGSGIFRSTDRGQSWTPANNGLPPAPDVRAFTSANNGTLAGLAGEGVYFSNDQGRNWTVRNTGLGNRFVNALSGAGATVYAGTQGGVYRSFDGGVNWAAANSGLTRNQVLSLAVSGNAVYAGTDNGLFRSTNQGASWTEVSTGLTDRYIVALGLAPDGATLLAGTSSGLFRSTNQGQSWTPVTNGLPDRVVALTFAQQRNRLLAGTVNGFFVSEDNGASWRQINGGLLTLQVGALAVSGDTVLAGTRSGGVFVSQLPQ